MLTREGSRLVHWASGGGEKVDESVFPKGRSEWEQRAEEKGPACGMLSHREINALSLWGRRKPGLVVSVSVSKDFLLVSSLLEWSVFFVCLFFYVVNELRTLAEPILPRSRHDN